MSALSSLSTASASKSKRARQNSDNDDDNSITEEKTDEVKKTKGDDSSTNGNTSSFTSSSSSSSSSAASSSSSSSPPTSTSSSTTATAVPSLFVISDSVKCGFSVVDVDSLRYHGGFGSLSASEALPGALPTVGNTPQKCAYGLFAEQLSGTSFTTPRANNMKSWLYRIRPTACHKPFVPVKNGNDSAASSLVVSNFDSNECVATPNQLRWRPVPLPLDSEQVDFVQGLKTIAGAGRPDIKEGLGIHIYTCNMSMKDKAMCNSDGDMLIVPQQGGLLIRSEFGLLFVPPTHICVIPRCVTFSVEVNGPSRGYICEVYNSHFRLPELGPIGSNGLANPRDFVYPAAAFEDRMCDFTVVQKFMGTFWQCQRDASPFDVVAWQGNYAPYKYDLGLFCPVNAVLYDHLDPSIFTVLSAMSNEPGVAVADFVIFPPRYAVQEHTFRPPYYHRNVMSEYMGNIMGVYEAKLDGFMPGGGSLHSIGAGHGPDADSFVKASNAPLKAEKLSTQSLAFMFESTYMYRVTNYALKDTLVDNNYFKCWQGLPRLFDATQATSTSTLTPIPALNEKK